LGRLDTIADRILERWPDIVSEQDGDREEIVQVMLGKLRAERWDDTKLSAATKAARILFDEDFRDRRDLKSLRIFYFEETAVSTNSTFLSAMMSVYMMSYMPGSAHTTALAAALQLTQKHLSQKWQTLLRQVPSILNPREAPHEIAILMREMDEPWSGLRALGIRSPHAPGLMDHAHLAYLKEIAPRLDERCEIDKLLNWLKPEGKDARSSGATEAIEALLAPWRETTPESELQSYLVEALVSFYRDPRVHRGFPWGGVEPSLMVVIMRWLTGENIRFFLDVVSAVEESHMWAPRRKFWLGLYERKMIDEAWVAFSREGAIKASSMRANTENRAGLAYGRQVAGGSRTNTSLLILKIGNCIVVEGSHSYKVHVFRGNNTSAPGLFQPRYDCERIRLTPGAETTPHLGNWQGRVRELIGHLS
jgi:hypothetical protein